MRPLSSRSPPSFWRQQQPFQTPHQRESNALWFHSTCSVMRQNYCSRAFSSSEVTKLTISENDTVTTLSFLLNEHESRGFRSRFQLNTYRASLVSTHANARSIGKCDSFTFRLSVCCYTRCKYCNLRYSIMSPSSIRFHNPAVNRTCAISRAGRLL